MKKLLSWALAAIVIVALPTMAMAKKTKGDVASGKVTAVTETTITVAPGKKTGGDPQTITVPAGTPITVKDGSTPPKLSELVGLKVKVTESAPGTAQSIAVKVKKSKKAA